MSEEEVAAAVAVSEQASGESQESLVEPQMVPLVALQAERRKRQEEQQMRQEVTARMAVLEQQLVAQRKEAEVPEDPEALVTKGDFKEEKALTKRELREEIYQENNPDKVTEINKHLKQILEKKPWLAASLDDAPNRYARAHEIVQDYKHMFEAPVSTKAKTPSAEDAARMVANSKKPGSPIAIGKSAHPDGVSFLKSIQGKKEFREYRQKLLRGES